MTQNKLVVVVVVLVSVCGLFDFINHTLCLRLHYVCAVPSEHDAEIDRFRSRWARPRSR